MQEKFSMYIEAEIHKKNVNTYLHNFYIALGFISNLGKILSVGGCV